MPFVNRQLEASIRSLLYAYPILALTGPRQSGKTTLLKTILPDYQYVSLENSSERSFAINDPTGFLKKYSSKVIFDEAQRAPDLFSYLQTAVDESGMMGQFVLSGSQNFHLLERITQSLAGRVALFKLLPFDAWELREANLLAPGWKSLLFKGFYPAVYDRDLPPAVFYSNYLETYINRDVANLMKVHDMRLFRNFIGLCAGRVGQMLNLSHLANECGISQPTAKSWLSILESSYILFLLPPYFENFNKRIVKTPKLYFYDVGLVSFLLGMREEEDLQDYVLIGSLFENLVISNILKNNFHRYQLQEFWFWRDAGGHEVDLLTKRAGQFHVFEIKSTQTILPHLFRGMDYFDSITNGKVKTKTLVYGGADNHDRTEYRIRSWNEADL
ncbi:MAG: ATP-binding protein [Haliscomenobacter sp.]|nr:ATP-binding protein [Haliscomenobacter sp.]MBK8877981.1 ATP-binding protein [Haliscomenobacter sp.]